MIKYYQQGTVWHNGAPQNAAQDADKCAGRNGTIAYQILNAHRAQSDDGIFHISFDALVSHDITYVGIIQTARASGLKEFPIPYAMTNCHNSLCAVGGTINEAVCLKLPECFSYGSPADAVPFTYSLFREFASVRYRPGQDVSLKFCI